MELFIESVVVLHLLGMAAIFSGWFAVRLGAERGVVALVWGARVQVLLGLVLVALNEAAHEELNHVKIGVKLAVTLAVVGCAEVASVGARRGTNRPALLNVAAALALVNVLVSVLWTTGT